MLQRQLECVIVNTQKDVFDIKLHVHNQSQKLARVFKRGVQLYVNFKVLITDTDIDHDNMSNSVANGKVAICWKARGQ